MKRNRTICLVLIYAFLLNSIAANARAQTQTSQTDEKPKGLQFRLREGKAQTAKSDVSAPFETVKLNETETDAIIRRLPPIEMETNDQADFATRPNSLPPAGSGFGRLCSGSVSPPVSIDAIRERTPSSRW